MARGLVPLPLPLPLPDKEEEEACCWKKLPISLPNEERASRPLLRSGADVRVLAGLLLPLLPFPLLLRLRSKEAAVVAAVVLALEVLVLVLADDADMDKGSSVAATGCRGGAFIVGTWAGRGGLEMTTAWLATWTKQRSLWVREGASVVVKGILSFSCRNAAQRPGHGHFSQLSPLAFGRATRDDGRRPQNAALLPTAHTEHTHTQAARPCVCVCRCCIYHDGLTAASLFVHCPYKHPLPTTIILIIHRTPADTPAAYTTTHTVSTQMSCLANPGFSQRTLSFSR